MTPYDQEAHVDHTGFGHFWHHVKYGLGVFALQFLLFPVEHLAWHVIVKGEWSFL